MSLKVLGGFSSSSVAGAFRSAFICSSRPYLNITRIAVNRFSFVLLINPKMNSLAKRVALIEKSPTLEESRLKYLMSFEEYCGEIERNYPNTLNDPKFSGLNRKDLLREGYDSYVRASYRTNIKNLFAPPPNPLIL